MNLLISAAIGWGLIFVCVSPVIAPPVGIKVLTTRAIATVLGEAGAEFESTTNSKLHITSDIAVKMVRRI